MTDELIDKLAEAIARYEGWYVTEIEARKRNMRWPTRAQRNANPGNVRRWADASGVQYPQRDGYVDFVAWARAKNPSLTGAELRAAAEREGWRVLRAAIKRILAKRARTLRELVAVWAPAADGNDESRYVAYLTGRLGIPPDADLRAV